MLQTGRKSEHPFSNLWSKKEIRGSEANIDVSFQTPVLLSWSDDSFYSWLQHYVLFVSCCVLWFLFHCKLLALNRAAETFPADSVLSLEETVTVSDVHEDSLEIFSRTLCASILLTTVYKLKIMTRRFSNIQPLIMRVFSFCFCHLWFVCIVVRFTAFYSF